VVQQNRAIVYIVYKVVKASSEQLLARDTTNQYVQVLTLWVVATAKKNVSDAVSKVVPLEEIPTGTIIEITSDNY